MRAVKVLLLAAFVCAVANAADDKKFVPVQPSHADTHKKLADHMSRFHAKINVAGAQKTVSNAFDEVKALSEIVTMKKSFQAEQFSAEVAACLADLNFIQAATPIQPICLADPAAVRASSGTFTQVSQVAGVCSGACVTALIGTLGNYKTCLRAFGFASLVDLMTSCQRTPECWTESVLTTRLSIEQTCMVPFSAAVGLYNYSTAAVTDAKAFCTGGCSSKMSTFIKTYPQCIVNTTLDESVQQQSAVAALAESLCSQKGNETDVCGVQLKALGRFSECGGYYCSATSWCNNNCMPDYTATRMDAMCGRCMGELGAAFKAFGLSSASTAMESLCLKTGTSASSSYCAVEFGSSLYYSSQSQSAFNTLCGGKRGSCVSRALTLQARSSEESAIEEFAQCAVNYRRRGVSVSSSSSFCSSNLAYELRSAYEATRYAKAVCAKSASAYCWPTVYDMYWSDGCVRSSSCSTSCKTSWSAQVTAAGCCTGYMDDYRSYSSGSRRLPTRTVTVTRGVYNITLDRIVAVQFSATVGEEQARSSRYTNGYTPCYTGDAAFWTTWESQCQVGNLTTPVKGELKLNLAYETLNADPLAKARAEAALTDDVAAAAAVASNQVSGSIVSASATRRQTTTTKAKFQYSINAGSQAEADAAVAAVNAQVSAGTLKLPAAQSTVATCTTCGASSSSSTVAEGQAAPSTVRPVIGAPGSSASPAAAAHAAVAVVFAVAMAMLL